MTNDHAFDVEEHVVFDGFSTTISELWGSQDIVESKIVLWLERNGIAFDWKVCQYVLHAAKDGGGRWVELRGQNSTLKVRLHLPRPYNVP